MLKKTVLVHALTLAFSAGLASVALPTAAYAASNSAGSLVGRAMAGTVVTIENKDIGLTRTITVGKDGQFQVTQLPPGTYTLSTTYADGSKENLSAAVNAGDGTTVTFAGPTAGQKVIVTGRATKIDVKSSESSQVLSKATIDRLPVTRDVTAVALLAPGATAGDTRIGSAGTRAGNVPSLGGASPAENVYYINGFNVTNSLNGVAFNQVPFDAIASQQVKTGGYGPEYGRSLGGVLSVTTKRGTNEWHGGANVIYSPSSLQGDSVYSEKSPTTGKWNLVSRPGGTDDLKSNLWIGGPVIEDKLYIFGLVQGASIKSKTYGNTEQSEVKNTSPQYLTKIDWNINDKNLLEFTAFSDKSKDKQYTYKSVVPYQTARGEKVGTDEFTTGGQNAIVKYTSWITDDFTVSALLGQGKYDRTSRIETAACPYVTDRRTSTTKKLGCATQTLITDPNAKDQRDAWRLDAEWNLGAHGLRFGMDNETYKTTEGSFYPGETNYSVRNLKAGSTLSNGYVNDTGSTLQYVQARTLFNGGTFKTKNSAFYLEDNWQVTKTVMASLGVRSESFNNLNAEGSSFIKVDNTIAPRLGLAWDVNGDAQTKVFANAGRYYIPVMSNTNVRLAGTETDYYDFYAFDGSFGSDKKQLPGMGAQLGSRQIVHNGEIKDPRTVVDPNIKPMFQDEYILGIQQALSNRWSVTAKATYRNLKSVMDDVCNDEGAGAWALGAGYTADQADTIAATVGNCFLYNPGKDLTANVDLGDGQGLTPITIPAAALKFPQPKRTYKALELGFERAWDGVWSLQGSYVLAYSKGNTEGYVKSDIGQDDAGIGQDWDYPGLMEGSYGFLPNDRRHTFKVFGAYQVAPEWRVGANVLIQSGRPRNCLGYYAGDLDGVSIGYQSASFYCNGELHPRGTWGRTPWLHELSVQANYEPKWMKGLSFQVDVLNVFNTRTVTSVTEEAEQGVGSPSPTFEQPYGIQKARSFRFQAQYTF
ncbi:TonB-dependent receptor [Massilia arenosa]|uniref:TonB-dependent receptor n=1 Tax=Zemynaea arenosa TaxID=2561931 RepID=A0A4Y9SV29_9BURK|nr:TonB-dependent receptor [Massilia arenosa]TFW30288.1 TonB-dependent receptor [Massilia arenosa]